MEINGRDFLSGTTVGLELVNDIFQQTHALAKNTKLVAIGTDHNSMRIEHTLENKLMAKEEKHNTLLDSQKDDIEFWKEQEEKFVDTQVVNVFSKLLESEQSVLMVGEPGIGKSMLLHNVALKLQKTIDYNIIPCTGIHDILQHHEKDKRQMFVLDDICGTLTVSMSAIEQWINNEDKLKRILKKGCTKIAAACRLDIYKDAKFQESFTIFESNIFNLSVLYSREDKLTICKNYLSDTNIQLLKSTNVEFTPLMCYLYHVYSKNKKFNLTEFLHCPFEKYTEEWNKLKGLDSYKYCSLFLLVIYNGIIKESLFEMFNENNTKSKSVLKYIFETCGIDRGTSRGRIKTVLDSMIGTYVMKSRSEYKVIHDQMFDFMCCYFGNKDTMVRCFIRFSDIRVFNERTQLQSVNEQYGKFTIMISKEHEKEYFERITKDVKLGKMNQCFYNTQMKYEVYRTLFLKILESIDEKILIAQLYQRKKPSLNLTYGYDSIETSKYQDYSDDDDEKYLIEGPFIISCLQGYHDIFQYFLSKKVDIENCYLIHTPLTAACKGGNEQIVQILVKRGCDVHQVDGMRQTPLTTACGADNVKIVQLLIDKGSDVNQFDCEGETPLAAACKRGNETIVQLLIEKGSKVNEVDGTRLTLLTAACEGGNEHIVEILLKKGCDVDQVDGMRQTPLITACKRRNETIVQLLIEKGSKVNQVGGTRLTPLTAACDKQNEQIVQLLTEKGCDVNQVDYIEQVPLLTACNERNEQLVQLLIDKGSEINLANGMGQTPLTTACSTGNVRLVQFLIKKGSNIEQVDGIGQTPLTIACKDGNQELVELLIDEKCEINRVDGLGQTPLIAACRKGNKNIVQLLINKGSDENQVDRIGQTPLTIACNEGNEKIVQLLLDKGSDVNQIVRKLKTPLSAACNIGKVSDVNQVDGSDVNQMYGTGETPLTCACQGENENIVQILIDKGSDVNKVGDMGLTPLTAACKSGNVKIVQLLIDNGSNVNKVDSLGKTPLTTSCSKKSDRTVLDKERYLNLVNGISLAALGVVLGLTQIIIQTACEKQIYDIKQTSLTAFNKRNQKIVEILIEKGGDINQIDRTGLTPLTAACMGGNAKIVELLIDSGSDVNQVDRMGQTPLTVACSADNGKIVQLLIEKGSVVNQEDDMEKTPLTAACSEDSEKKVQLLREKGSDVNQEDDMEKTTLTAACNEDNEKIVQLPKDNGSYINYVGGKVETPLLAACKVENEKIVQ